MSTPDDIRSSPVGQKLAEAHARAEAGNFTAAIAAVREAKTREPKNVYVLAFEKQAEQLSEFASAGTLTEEQRTDILESFPAIIEKAVELSRTSAGVTNISGLGKAAANVAYERKEKAAALEWLKNQYFQHAHEYVRKGEYQHALAEIRRVFIIDSENRVARDFEKQIGQLAQLKTQQGTVIQPVTPQPTRDTPSMPARQEVPESLPQDSELTPMMTEEWSSPQDLLRKPRQSPVPRKAPPEKKKGNRILVVGIILGLIVLCATAYWYYQRNVLPRKGASPQKGLPPPASEQYLGEPGQATEQSFVVSPSDSDSVGVTPKVTPAPGGGDENGQLPQAPRESRSEAPRGPSSFQGAPERDDTQSRPGTDTPLQSAASPSTQAAIGLPVQSLAPPQKNEDTASSAPFVAVEREARIIKLAKPKFSSIAYRMGIEGQVVLQVQIDPEGRPVQTITLQSTNDLLIQPVIEAVLSSTFAPAEVSTGPVTSWLTIPFRFSNAKE